MLTCDARSACACTCLFNARSFAVSLQLHSRAVFSPRQQRDRVEGERPSHRAMAQNSGGKNFWGLMQSIVVDSGLAAAAGEAVATRVPAGARSHLAAAGEAVARSVRRSAFEVVPPSELGLVLLTSRLTDLAYCATTPEAIAAGVSTLLAHSSLVWFKPQDPRSAAHDAQWYLARGTLPPGVDGPGGPALFLVFRGTQSVVDVMNDVMARPKAAVRSPSPGPGPGPNP